MILFSVGMVTFFILGLLAGQSRFWFALRKTWNHFMVSDEDETDVAYSMWTLRRLADYLAEESGLGVSFETVRRELAKADIIFSRSQHTISSPDPLYQAKKRRLKKPETD